MKKNFNAYDIFKIKKDYTHKLFILEVQNFQYFYNITFASWGFYTSKSIIQDWRQDAIVDGLFSFF